MDKYIEHLKVTLEHKEKHIDMLEKNNGFYCGLLFASTTLNIFLLYFLIF